MGAQPVQVSDSIAWTAWMFAVVFLEFIELENCSPNTPDLNPVDYSVWEAFQQIVYRQKILNIDRLNAC